MYTAYFGLSEAPFTIAPDPAYLFMSSRHKEALAHLSHGLGDSGGFVLLTGEVGTGKTTISRTVMEKLPENTQAAFILNPTLSSDELLATICDSLNIRYKKSGATLKYLTDKIQEKLLANHEQDINTLVVIDEAQHLQPEVLEQLRLLTNLETNTKKLLQVVLIGQPELQQLLQRRDLRQLAQRITARYHLLPLTLNELTEYIEHRLSVAQCQRNLFNASAIKAIHKISNGIPRVVNVLCDRALILAYGQNQSLVNKKIIYQAADEALGAPLEPRDSGSLWLKSIAIGLGVSVFMVLGIGLGIKFLTEPVSPVVTTSETLPPAKTIATNEMANGQLLESAEKITPIASTNTIKSADHQDITGALQSEHERLETADDNNDQSIANTEAESKEPLVLGHNVEQYKQQQSQSELGFELTAEDDVSPELLAAFKQAIIETDAQAKLEEKPLLESDFQPINKMPENIQNSLPALSFELHMYASDGKGWVRVNGKDFSEGQQIASGVVLQHILPQHVVLLFKEHSFTIPALTNW
ncbi:AAA family ATPase [Thalassotalea marina]|uniref:AAA+ ATPase domain-containing protein n=1 Tax=Thalassotalea marina TaxID=1673741 RepID=A0A919BDZ8_9GAMM|nr:AAA family ATPase [Thalassotalea marina]GHF85071.1 hypothetical protein GCM10017161_10720 [Thalassotalea marina]